LELQLAIVSHKHRLVYFPLAKNCSTSLKHLFYELETGLSFRKARAKFSLPGHIHTYFPTLILEDWVRFYGAYDTMVVVRDPISRFLSGYGNRIIHARALETRGNIGEMLKAENLPTMPDLNEFVDNLEKYLSFSSYMRSHLSPQASVIGEIFPRIQHVFQISNVGRIPEFFRERRGLEVKLRHDQSVGPKFKPSDLSKDRLDKLVAFYEDDYKMLKDFFTPPTS
jgi:hypothetical protein